MNSKISKHLSFLNKSQNKIKKINEYFERLLINRSFYSINIMANNNINHVSDIVIEKLKIINTKLKALIYIDIDTIEELHNLFNCVFVYYTHVLYIGVDIDNCNNRDVLIYKSINLFYKYYIHNLYRKVISLQNDIIPMVSEIYDYITIILKDQIIKDDILIYEKCLKIYNKKSENILNDKFLEICNKIIDYEDILRILNNKNKTVHYYEQRCENSKTLCNDIKDEFFTIAYRPDIYQKIVLDEKEIEFIKNNFH